MSSQLIPATRRVLNNAPLLDAAHGKTPTRTPVWFMRQAGRSLPEYLKVREGISMLDSCFMPELLAEIGAPDEMVHAICSHAYGLSSDVEPVHTMEKILFAVDELTGLIGAAARMRPSKSVMDMELSSLKKKYKDKKFAAGCSREVIAQGAERLGWTLDETLEKTILAMRSCEADIAREMETI